MNLKECIDWVLRATGKDNGIVNNINNLNKALKAELKGSVNTVDLNAELKALASGLEKFIGYDSGRLTGTGIGKNDTGGSQYASSYKPEATWEKLCQNCKCKTVSKSNSSCNCSCSGSQTVVCSNPSDCCPDCNVRKAAKIFLGILPCLYYALQYLKDKCKGGGGWSSHNIINKDHSLHRFLRGMGFEIGQLQDKNGQNIFDSLSSHIFNGSEPLKDLYDVSQKYFTSSSSSHVPSSSSQSKPKTVREMLLWLSGLPFTSGFKALLDHCKGLCDSTGNSVKFIDFESSLFDSCFLSPFVLGAIEGSKSNPLFIYDSLINKEKFFYPSDPSDLLENLCDFVRKIYIPLNFLCIQCKNDSGQGGWKDCYFGLNCKVDPLPSSSPSGCSSCDGHETYVCTYSDSNKNVHDEHCQNGQCINSGPCSKAHSNSNNANCKPCPHPLLRFLIDDFSESQSTSKDPQTFATPFKPPEGFPPMGFSKDHLPSPGRSGESLFFILDIFVGKADTNDKLCLLRDLLRLLLCLTRAPPETLGELFGFFLQFSFSDVFSSKLKDFADYVTGEPGRPDGRNFTNAFQSALQKLKGSSHSNSHSGSHSDLKSLYDCVGGSTCGPYLNPLTGDVYKDFIEDSPGLYLSWICYLPKDFKTLLEEFKQKFSKCCLNPSSGPSCKSIVKCPCALPFLYSYGFTFMKASNLSGKNCSNFIDQVEKVANGDPFKNLLKEIERFLWSIRLPFVYTFLYIWILVISYFYYVQFYKLDLLHIDSHLHLPRSFKIPPSILFSDASSKLKDLSYFSL